MIQIIQHIPSKLCIIFSICPLKVRLHGKAQPHSRPSRSFSQAYEKKQVKDIKKGVTQTILTLQ